MYAGEYSATLPYMVSSFYMGTHIIVWIGCHQVMNYDFLKQCVNMRYLFF